MVNTQPAQATQASLGKMKILSSPTNDSKINIHYQ